MKEADGTVLTKDADYAETITNSDGETEASVNDIDDYTLTLTGLSAAGCYGSYSKSFRVIEGDGTGGQPFLIDDVASWDLFAQRVNNGETGLDGILVADVDLGDDQTMVGTSNKKYSGRFDGNGHTLTVHYNTTAEYTAPFRYVRGGRIYNLHTAGTIQTSAKFAGGIVAGYYGESSALMNCRSSVTIISSLNGDGTQSSPYLITSDEDWETFAYALNSGSRMIDIYVALTNDITVRTTAGIKENNFDFCGNLEGNGHTMTLDKNTSSDYGGPIHISAGYINNLHVTGTLRTSGRYAGGLVGYASGGVDLYNCWSSVTIISSYNGEGYLGGLVGVDYYASGIELHNCLFDGKLLTTGGTTNCSGLVGEAFNQLYIYNCLSSPAELAEGETACGSCNTLYHIDMANVMQGQASNYYLPAPYMTTLQGDDASPYTPEELVGLLGSEWSLLDGKPVPIHQIFDLVGSGSSSDPYLIRNIDDWRAFSSNVRSGNTYDGKYFLMTADIDLGDDQSMIGTSRYGFGGHFDGGGYTLTVHYVSTGDFCAPFSYLKSNEHTFKNLHTAGTIQTSGKYAAGIISNNRGYYGYVTTNTLEKCRSSVIITSTREGEGIIGGLIAEHSGQLVISNCLFDGSILGENTHTCSGLLGVNVGNSVGISHSLYNPKEQTVGTTNSCTLGRNGNSYYPNAVGFTTSYYTRTLGTAQDNDGSQMTGAELVQALGAQNWTLEDGQPVPRVVKPVELNGSGTENDPYLIASEQDWNNLANNLEAEINYQDKHFLQTADITVSTMAGTNDYPFNGIYDGDGHTLTFNAGTADAYQSEQHCAPFRYVKNATVKNLKTEGNIYTSSSYAAGLASYVSGNFTVTNCLSNISINSSVDGDGTHGGFVARAMAGVTVFTGCVFSGELLGTTTHSCGGFVGWTETNDGATAVFTNCLFAPQACSFNSNNSKTFSRTRNESQSLSYNNTYRLSQLGGAQGKLAHSISGGEAVTVALAGETIEHPVSGITANGTGIEYNGVALASQGDNVSLTFGGTAPSGYAVSGYETSAGTLTSTENPYTLAMPNADVTITAIYGPADWETLNEGTEDDPYLIYNTGQ